MEIMEANNQYFGSCHFCQDLIKFGERKVLGETMKKINR